MAPLKPQYEAVRDPLVTVAAKIPASVQRAIKRTSDDLAITSSMLIRLALEQYLDGIKNADLSLKLELIALGVGEKAAEITFQNALLLENQENIKKLLWLLVDENSDLDGRVWAEVAKVTAPTVDAEHRRMCGHGDTK